MKKYYLAIDIGASSGRHIVSWIENGVMQTEEIYRFSNNPVQKNGHLKWDTERLFQEILNGLKNLNEKQLDAISIIIESMSKN